MVRTTDNRLSELRQEGSHAYSLMAVVRHLESPHDADCIRVFCEDGLEQLPTLAARTPMPDWGFTASEKVPSGVKLTLFYAAVSHPSPEISINERHMLHRVPDEFRQPLSSSAIDVQSADLAGPSQKRKRIHEGISESPRSRVSPTAPRE